MIFKKRINSVFVLLLIGNIFLSCNKESNSFEEYESPKLYFPLEEGCYWEYDVVDVFIDAALTQYDTSNYSLRMEYDSFDEELEQHVLIRYWKNEIVDQWQFFDNILVKWNDDEFNWFEQNERFIKLNGTLKVGRTWDGNKYNGRNARISTYFNIEASNTVNDIHFSPSVEVEKETIDNAIVSSTSKEIFAKEVGIIYEYRSDFRLQAGQIVEGTSRQLSLKNYGK